MPSGLSGMILFQSKEIVTYDNTYGAATTYVTDMCICCISKFITIYKCVGLCHMSNYFKILGIGEAERLWGDVKCIKTGKCLHIKDELLKKQLVIFGAASMEKSRILKDPHS
eukprot:6258080-Ditylum_brightwellii.AAC.1